MKNNNIRIAIIFSLLVHVGTLYVVDIKEKANANVLFDSSNFIKASLVTDIKTLQSSNDSSDKNKVADSIKIISTSLINAKKNKPKEIKKPTKVTSKKQENKKTKSAKISKQKQNNKRGGNTNLKTNSTDAKTNLKKGRKENTIQKKQKDTSNSETESNQKETQENKKSIAEQQANQRLQNRLNNYFKRFHQILVDNWTRPANLNLGDDLEVEIQINLSQNGVPTLVKVGKSSGNKLFDRSAISAIKKVEKFLVPTDKELFDKYFKKVTIIFTNPV